MTIINGIAPVLVTPMDAKGEPDPAGTKALVDLLVGAGVGGLWVLGSASEDVNMTRAQRLASARHVVAANAGRVPLLVGTGQTTMDQVLEFALELEGQDLQGIHVLFLDGKQHDSRMIANLSRLADRCPFPVWLYHNPKRGKPVSLSVIREIKHHPNVAGMKVGGYSLSDMINALMEADEGFEVLGAGGGQFFTMLCNGANGHTGSDACCWPEEFVRAYRLFKEGKLAEAREVQFGLIRLSKSLPRTDNGEYAAEEKYILSLRGICGEGVNPSYRTLSHDEKAGVRAALRAYGFDWAPRD